MKIVYFAHSVLNRGGDRMILSHLAHLAGAGHDVAIRTNLVATNYEIHPAIRIDRPLFGGKAGTILSALLEKSRADLLIATIVPVAVCLFVRNRSRVVYFAQDDNETAFCSPFLKLVARMLSHLSRVFRIPTIAISRALATTLRIDGDPLCRVVGNGVDTGKFYPEAVPELVAAKGGRKAILLLAHGDWRKGFDVAQRVVGRLEPALQARCTIWTVGEGKDPGWPGGHHFGLVDPDTLRGIMGSADVFLYPGRSEGFCLMVLEAMVCGCPVVTTDAIPYAVHEENALVTSIDDVEEMGRQVRRVLTDDLLANGLSVGGRALVRQYSLAESSALFEAALVGVRSSTAGRG